MNFFYKNHKGERLNLSEPPYIFQDGDVLNWLYSYDNDGAKTNNYTNGPKEYKIKVAVVADKGLSCEEREKLWKQSVDNLVEIASADVANDKMGAIYTDTGYYLPCKISGFEKTSYSRQGNVISGQFTIVADSQYWINEVLKTFISSTNDISDANFLDYPHDYPYDYLPNGKGDTINNAEISPADFQMIIYGPCSNPEVIISSNKYQIVTTILTNEYAVLNTQERVVYKVSKTGLVTNIWSSLNRDYDNFKPIPNGTHNVAINGALRVDITLYQRRSEPRWS